MSTNSQGGFVGGTSAYMMCTLQIMSEHLHWRGGRIHFTRCYRVTGPPSQSLKNFVCCDCTNTSDVRKPSDPFDRWKRNEGLGSWENYSKAPVCL